MLGELTLNLLATIEMIQEIFRNLIFQKIIWLPENIYVGIQMTRFSQERHKMRVLLIFYLPLIERHSEKIYPKMGLEDFRLPILMV